MIYKKYLYSFRGVVNALWVYYNNDVPPINFLEVVDKSESLLGKQVYLKLKEIIELKSQGKEKDIIENINFLDEYIQNFINLKHDILSENKMEVEFLNNELKKIVMNQS